MEDRSVGGDLSPRPSQKKGSELPAWYWWCLGGLVVVSVIVSAYIVCDVVVPREKQKALQLERLSVAPPGTIALVDSQYSQRENLLIVDEQTQISCSPGYCKLFRRSRSDAVPRSPWLRSVVTLYPGEDGYAKALIEHRNLLDQVEQQLVARVSALHELKEEEGKIAR